MSEMSPIGCNFPMSSFAYISISRTFVVHRGRIELPTRGFSVLPHHPDLAAKAHDLGATVTLVPQKAKTPGFWPGAREDVMKTVLFAAVCSVTSIFLFCGCAVSSGVSDEAQGSVTSNVQAEMQPSVSVSQDAIPSTQVAPPPTCNAQCIWFGSSSSFQCQGALTQAYACQSDSANYPEPPSTVGSCMQAVPTWVDSNYCQQAIFCCEFSTTEQHY